MKAYLFCLGEVLPLLLVPSLLVAGIQVREPANENEASPSPSPELLTATEVADKGVAVGEAPQTQSTKAAESSIVETEVAKPTNIVDAVYPENHKNFSASPYLGSIEPPPSLQEYNRYQQQYKQYYAQKSQYSALKPVKFEDNADEGLSSYGDDSQGSIDTEARHKPFPYLFQQDHLTMDSETQPVYPIPEENLVDSSPETADLKAPSAESIFTPFLSGFPLGNLFGGRGSSHVAKEHKSESSKHKGFSWKKALRLVSTVLPLGLFLATLTPNILVINATEEVRPSRLRSLDDATSRSSEDVADPLIQMIRSFGGLEAMEDPVCEDRFFCEMSILGQKEESNLVEKGFWYLANHTPESVAEEVGMLDLFKAIRTNTCERFNCKPKHLAEQTGKKEKVLSKGKRPKMYKKIENVYNQSSPSDKS